MMVLVILAKQYQYTPCEMFEVDTDIQFYTTSSFCSLNLQDGRNAFNIIEISLKKPFFLHFAVQFVL